MIKVYMWFIGMGFACSILFVFGMILLMLEAAMQK